MLVVFVAASNKAAGRSDSIHHFPFSSNKTAVNAISLLSPSSTFQVFVESALGKGTQPNETYEIDSGITTLFKRFQNLLPNRFKQSSFFPFFASRLPFSTQFNPIQFNSIRIHEHAHAYTYTYHGSVRSDIYSLLLQVISRR